MYHYNGTTFHEIFSGDESKIIMMQMQDLLLDVAG
jgi:hypothetical protein